MNLNKFNDIIKDIQSFADDEYEVIAEAKTGEITFNRNRITNSIFVYEDENEMTWVKYNNSDIPYIKYLKEYLAFCRYQQKLLLHSSNQNLNVLHQNLR